MGQKKPKLRLVKTKAYPKKIQLNETEILRLENINLRIDDASRVVRVLQEQRNELAKNVARRCGVDTLEVYRFDAKGHGELVGDAPAAKA